MSTSKPFHHGDLKAALETSAFQLLEAHGSAELALRQVARHAGVSAAAPYRHYADKDELLAAVARRGFDMLYEALVGAVQAPDAQRVLLHQCVAYVRFALQHRAVFRLMFGSTVDKRRHPELRSAGDRVFAVLEERLGTSDTLPRSIRAAGCWALVHGLATLALDNQLETHFQHLDEKGVEAILRPLVAAFGDAD